MKEEVEKISKESLDLLLTQVSEQRKEIAALEREVERLQEENRELRERYEALDGEYESLYRRFVWFLSEVIKLSSKAFQELAKLAPEVFQEEEEEEEQPAKESMNG